MSDCEGIGINEELLGYAYDSSGVDGTMELIRCYSPSYEDHMSILSPGRSCPGDYSEQLSLGYVYLPSNYAWEICYDDEK